MAKTDKAAVCAVSAPLDVTHRAACSRGGTLCGYTVEGYCARVVENTSSRGRGGERGARGRGS